MRDLFYPESQGLWQEIFVFGTMTVLVDEEGLIDVGDHVWWFHEWEREAWSREEPFELDQGEVSAESMICFEGLNNFYVFCLFLILYNLFNPYQIISISLRAILY